MSHLTFRFSAPLIVDHDHLYAHHYYVPEDIVRSLKEHKIKRFLVSINDHANFSAGLISGGDQRYFIKVNQTQRKKMNLQEGVAASIDITKDDSPYGMPLPDEFAALWKIDQEAYDRFHQLPPGKQRNLIYIVNKIKNKELRAQKSWVIMDHLKINNGKIDFKALNEALKSRY